MESPPPHEGQPRTSPAPAPHRPGIREQTVDFDSYLNAYLHQRLRLLTLIQWTGGAILLVVVSIVFAALTSEVAGAALNAVTGTMLILVLAPAGAWLYLQKSAIPTRTLRVIDAVVTLSVVAVCTFLYHLAFRKGPTYLVPLLGLFVLIRAVIVPSRALRTLVLSAPVVPAILLVQLVNPGIYAWSDTLFPHASGLAMVAFGQVFLILTVLLATLTSRVNFSLRQKAYEATQLGQYILGERIAGGGMGEIYRARHALLRRPTAVKVIRPDLADQGMMMRFEQEVRQTARLTHPNTISVYDYGQTEDGVFYYAMELLDGADLGAIIGKTGPMPPARAIHVLVQVCGALEEAHEVGLVHRDIKPGNIILCRRGLVPDVAKVMDFGLVKDTLSPDPSVTAIGGFCGNPQTISPEAVRGEAVGPAADLYALGAVGCFLLTGQPIFDAESPIGFMMEHLTEAPIPPSARGIEVPEDLERILLCCLEKQPEDRPSSAAALRSELLGVKDAGNWDREAAECWWRDFSTS